jgi:hypothetical protein
MLLVDEDPPYGALRGVANLAIIRLFLRVVVGLHSDSNESNQFNLGKGILLLKLQPAFLTFST